MERGRGDEIARILIENER